MSSFELAIDEGSKDSEIKELVEIIKTYIASIVLLEEGDFESAKEGIENIGISYPKYSIKEDIDNLKVSINEKLNFSNTFAKEVENLKDLYEKNSLGECNKIIKTLRDNELEPGQKEILDSMEEKIKGAEDKLVKATEEEKRQEEEKEPEVLSEAAGYGMTNEEYELMRAVVGTLNTAKAAYPEFTDWSGGEYGNNNYDEPCILFTAYSKELDGEYCVFVNEDDFSCSARRISQW